MAIPMWKFAEWLWSKRDCNFAFHPSVLTEKNLDESLPRPALKPLDAESVFLYLEDLKLVFPKETADGFTAYAINKMKPHEWNAAIADLKKPAWMRSAAVVRLRQFLVWASSLIIAGFIGGGSRLVLDRWVEPHDKTLSHPPTKIHQDRSDNQKQERAERAIRDA